MRTVQRCRRSRMAITLSHTRLWAGPKSLASRRRREVDITPAPNSCPRLQGVHDSVYSREIVVEKGRPGGVINVDRAASLTRRGNVNSASRGAALPAANVLITSRTRTRAAVGPDLTRISSRRRRPGAARPPGFGTETASRTSTQPEHHRTEERNCGRVELQGRQKDRRGVTFETRRPADRRLLHFRCTPSFWQLDKGSCGVGAPGQLHRESFDNKIVAVCQRAPPATRTRSFHDLRPARDPVKIRDAR